jgi:hypothetical protein
VKEYPGGWGYRAEDLAERLRRPLEFLDLPNYRWQIVQDSPPAHFRTLFLCHDGLSRIGLDELHGWSSVSLSHSHFSPIQ